MDNNINIPQPLFTTLETTFRDALTRSLRDYLNEHSPRTTRPPRHVPSPVGSRRGSARPVDRPVDRPTNLQTIQLLRDVVRSNTLVMTAYNTSIVDYNQNMREISQLIRMLSIQQPIAEIPPPISHVHNPLASPSMYPRVPPNPVNMSRGRPITRPYQNTNDFFSFLLHPDNANRDTLFNTVFNDVVIYPTTEQIERATEHFEYLDTMVLSNTHCPITLGDFQVGDTVRRIHACGHCFQSVSLLHWFRSSVACPICRCDIRDYVEPVANNDNNDNNDNDNNDDNDSDDSDDSDDNHTDETTHLYPTSFTFTDASRNNAIPQSTTTLPNVTTNTDNDFGESIQTLLMNALNEGLSGVNVSTIPNDPVGMPSTSGIPSTSGMPIMTMEIPIDYEEYYDASNNVYQTNYHRRRP